MLESFFFAKRTYFDVLCLQSLNIYQTSIFQNWRGPDKWPENLEDSRLDAKKSLRCKFSLISEILFRHVKLK